MRKNELPTKKVTFTVSTSSLSYGKALCWQATSWYHEQLSCLQGQNLEFPQSNYDPVLKLLTQLNLNSIMNQEYIYNTKHI